MPLPPAGWRVELPGPQPVPDALALSERLLGEIGGAPAGTPGHRPDHGPDQHPGHRAPALVVHRVAPAAITVGRAQRGDADPAAAAAEGLDVVLRPSGGGPVLWDDDLIAIDVILPAGHPLLPADIVAAYRWVGEAVAGALTGLGVAGARALPPDEARAWPSGAAAAMCFGGLSPWEVVAGDRKVLGLSQVRRTTGAIIQVGVPMRLDAERLARAMGAPAGAADELGARTAGVADLARGVTREVAEQALVQALLGAAAATGPR